METKNRIITRTVRIGKNLLMGGGNPIVIQTMCNTHTSDVEATVAQIRELSEAGAELVRITVPGLQDVPKVKEIIDILRSEGNFVPVVADIHFSADTAIAVAPLVEKVRINPGNFHKNYETARELFIKFIAVCKQHDTAIRIGVNYGSLGAQITEKFGNTPLGMAMAALDWIKMCEQEDFHNYVVSLKASNTVTMSRAYSSLVNLLKESDMEIPPMHVGVTEAGGGDTGRIKSCVGIATVLSEGIGDTIRVSLTEPPVNEIPVARYLAHAEKGDPMLDAAITWGPKLLKGEIDRIPEDAGVSQYLDDEIMQAARRRFYKPDYIACPGCGRTMYNLQETFEQVKARTSHLKDIVIAVMGCIVNGPGEMADADWGYVGEGGGKVSIYKKGQPILRHVPDYEAIDKLLELITQHTEEDL